MRTQSDCSGGVLIGAMIAVLVVSTAVAVAVRATGGTSRMTERSRDFSETKLVAEGALEYAYGVWKNRVQNKDGAITTAEAVASFPAPSFSGFSYSTPIPATDWTGALKIQATDSYGAPLSSTTATPVSVVVSLPKYPGWRGRSYNYLASAHLEQTSPRGPALSAGVKRRFQYVEVPLFQAMFFYEHDIEMYAPAPMIISGLVHTNSSLFLSTGTANTLTLQGNVSYVDKYFPGNNTANNTYANTHIPSGDPADPYDVLTPPGIAAWSGYAAGQIMYAPIYPNGASTQVNQVSRYEPLGTDPASSLSSTNTNPNDDTFREIIEPPSTAIDPATGSVYADPAEISKRRMYNKAGIVVSVTGTNVTVNTQNGTTLTTAQVNSIKAAMTSKNTIRDQREGVNVDVANFDVSALTPVLNAASGFNSIIYIQDVSPVTSSDPEPKTLRLLKGGVLPTAGLSVVSQNPVYVQGDYNTGTTTSSTAVPANSTGNPNNTDSPTASGYTRKPAAVMADAVMLLSNAWNDSNASSTISSRVASNTTYNMAILAGVMPSSYLPPVGDPHYGLPAYGYSGGANNFPRFMETWSSKSCTYYGSMVELFQSKVFTGKWDTGNIYVPPARRWNFDTLYMDTPPPGSLDAVSISRGSWMKF